MRSAIEQRRPPAGSRAAMEKVRRPRMRGGIRAAQAQRVPALAPRMTRLRPIKISDAQAFVES
jgi:hypothetical protein